MAIERHLRHAIRLVPAILLSGTIGYAVGERAARVHEQAGILRQYQQGIDLLQANKIEQAIGKFQQVIHSSPQFAPAHNLLGVCLSRQGKRELAHKAFLAAVRFDPRLAEARNNLGTSYLELGKPAEAASQFQRAAELNPTDASSLFNLGRTRLMLKQPQSALTALKRAQKLSPGNPQIALALGEGYFMAGEPISAVAVAAPICARTDIASDFKIAAGGILANYQHSQDAERCFLSAASADPAARDEILSLTSSLIDEGNYKTALEILLPLKQKMDASAAYHDLVGFAQFRLAQPIPAIESFQTALRLDPGNENYYLDLGQVLEEYDAYEPAIELFRWAIAAHPGSARLRVGLALACLPAARMKEARDAAEKAIALDPALETGYTALAMVYEGEKDWQALLRNARQLQKLTPRNHLGWYYEALAQIQTARTQRSATVAQIAASLRRAIELSPSFPLAHFQLGNLFFQEKDYAASAAELRRAVELDPVYPEGHFLLATVYRKLGDLSNAEQQLEIHRKLVTQVESRQRPHLDVKLNKPY